MTGRLRVASYNILADAYLRPEWYRHVEPRWLDPAWRAPALVARIARLEADLVALQEVEPEAFARIAAGLRERGFEAHFAQKRGRPDGCALLYRRAAVDAADFEVLYFDDGIDAAPASGHLALIGRFDTPLGALHLACTHLRWAPDETPAAQHIGWRQARELVERCLGPRPQRWIVCGDLNGIESSAPIAALRAAGLRDAFAALPQPTCNPNARCKRIDYLLHTPDLRAWPEPLTTIGDDTPLPSREEPSDHLPLLAGFAPA